MTKKLRYLCTLLLMAVASVTWSQSTYTLGWGAATGDEGTFTNFTNAASGEVEGLLSYTTAKNGATSNPAISNNQLRLYYNSSGNGGSITITPAKGKTITSAVITSTVEPAVNYSVDEGTAKSVTPTGSSGNFVYTISGISAKSSLMIQNANTTNTQLRIKTIKITYIESSLKKDCDLAISGSTDLAFDLYNNKDAQVISYTTSSTGEVTVEESEYATFSVDKTNKKITVTPKAFTPNKQTITVTQAADDNYYKGTATFSFTVADSTPFDGGEITFDATVDKGNATQGAGSIIKTPVTFACTNGVLALNDNGPYRLYANSTTTISTSSGKITNIKFTMASGYAATLLSTTTGSYSDGTWTGKATSVAFSASAQARVTKIVVTVKTEVSEVSVEIGETGYATLYYSDKALAIPDGVTASYVSSLEGTKINTQAFSSTIPAGQGAILEGTPGTTYTFNVVENPSIFIINMLKGTDEKAMIVDTEADDYYYYKFVSETDGVGFWWGAAGGGLFENGAHKAYLRVAKSYFDSASPAKVFYLFGGDGGVSTGINNVEKIAEGAAIYNLNGVRVNKMQKGVYVVNGKKVVIK